MVGAAAGWMASRNDVIRKGLKAIDRDESKNGDDASGGASANEVRRLQQLPAASGEIDKLFNAAMPAETKKEVTDELHAYLNSIANIERGAGVQTSPIDFDGSPGDYAKA